MGAILIYFIMAYIFIKMFKKPYVAAIAYLTFGVMQPQYIWFWYFDNLPTSPSKVLAIIAILAWIFAAINKQVDFTVYKSKQSAVLLIMWGLIHLSNITSPFTVYSAGVPAEVVLGTLNTIIIMYFVCLGLLTSEDALKYLSIGLVALVLYYVYWSNSQYLDNNWSQFNHGRLMGPNRSIYIDENVFSTIFMIGAPFILYSFFYVKNNLLKYYVFIAIPLLWSSLFLAGSRGAMIATIVSTFIASRLCKSKVFNKILIIGFIVALLTQGGAMLNRSDQTIEMSQNNTSNEPINPRIISWKHGLSYIQMFPFTGVGVQRFSHATRTFFPESIAHVAHNTFIQLAAESGLLVGLLYLYLFWLAFENYKYCVANNVKKYPIIDYVNKATITALVGFFICAIFLNLAVFEAFYYLLIMTAVKQRVFELKLEQEQNENSYDKEEI